MKIELASAFDINSTARMTLASRPQASNCCLGHSSVLLQAERCNHIGGDLNSKLSEEANQKLDSIHSDLMDEYAETKSYDLRNANAH